jgi:hypothetical protein
MILPQKAAAVFEAILQKILCAIHLALFESDRPEGVLHSQGGHVGITLEPSADFQTKIKHAFGVVVPAALFQKHSHGSGTRAYF